VNVSYKDLWIIEELSLGERIKLCTLNLTLWQVLLYLYSNLCCCCSNIAERCEFHLSEVFANAASDAIESRCALIFEQNIM